MTRKQDTHTGAGKSPDRTHTSGKTTLVGIGASAGGLAALKALFATMPPDPGVSFVVVIHLSPDDESHFSEVLQTSCPMPVKQVTHAVELKPNHVYVIPPNAILKSVDTHHLRLSPPRGDSDRYAPIDYFFRTMAGTHDGDSVGIVLSGTGSDGTLGLRRIKEAGGLTIVQTSDEADYDGMPCSAIADGMVDLVLPISRMRDAILRFTRVAPELPNVEDGIDAKEVNTQFLSKILSQIRARTGHDFARYKKSTILRRIQRRMQIQQLDTPPEYLDLLRNDGREVKQLSEDLLSTVTQFFRDPEVFEYLEHQIISPLFAGKTETDHVRVWSVGCSTGEEAYSLAILLAEAAGTMESPSGIQVFATDLHEKSLERAREGFYPETIASDVTQERLERFFTRGGNGHRASRELREMVVFASHDLLTDPPFTHLDMIVCRNLMIYLEREIQQEVLKVFHYTLEPDGILLIGNSESVSPSDLFVAERGNLGVYRRQNPSPSSQKPGSPLRPARVPFRGQHSASFDSPSMAGGFGALHATLAEQYAPPSIMLTHDHEVVHYSAQAGQYLVIPGGKPTSNAFKLVMEPLRIELRSALQRAAERGELVYSRPVKVHLNGELREVVLRVRATTGPKPGGFYLVIFDDIRRQRDDADGRTLDDNGADTREMEAELELTRNRLKAVIAEYETSQEEMRTSNEDLQSANEELRSTLEELQSMNEDLNTVNNENHHHVDELNRLTSDLENLLAATDIATLFLDREFRILWFTPRVAELFNIRQGDEGRPLSDQTHHVSDTEILADAELVLNRLVPLEREVSSDDGRWFLARVLPYRAPQGSIDGVVITMIDITARKKAEQSLIEAHDGLEQRVSRRTEELEAQKSRLRYLAHQLASVEHRERKRMAAILHDDLQQYLVALKMKFRKLELERDGDPARFAQTLSRGVGLIEKAIACSRDLTQHLRPPVLYEDGFIPALRWLAGEMAQKHGLKIEVGVQDNHVLLDEDIRAMLFDNVR
ncbi:MAG: CheR family methyltransferase, partial [Pseudohongiellaceae bacterium]